MEAKTRIKPRKGRHQRSLAGGGRCGLGDADLVGLEARVIQPGQAGATAGIKVATVAGSTAPLPACAQRRARSRYEGLVGMRTETRLRVEASGMAIVAASESLSLRRRPHRCTSQIWPMCPHRCFLGRRSQTSARARRHRRFGHSCHWSVAGQNPLSAARVEWLRLLRAW